VDEQERQSGQTVWSATESALRAWSQPEMFPCTALVTCTSVALMGTAQGRSWCATRWADIQQVATRLSACVEFRRRISKSNKRD